MSRQVSHELGSRLDDELNGNPHYLYCRKVGQLLPPAVVQISADGYANYVKYEMGRGKRLGEIKPCALSTDGDWRERFQASVQTITLKETSGDKRLTVG